MILHNIIFPHKHPYITPQVTFEEIEGDDMMTVSPKGTDDGMGKDPNDDKTPTTPPGTDPVDPFDPFAPSPSKSSTFDDGYSDFIF